MTKSEWRPLEELEPDMGYFVLRFRDDTMGPGHFNPDGSLHWYMSYSVPTHFYIVPPFPEEERAKFNAEFERHRTA